MQRPTLSTRSTGNASFSSPSRSYRRMLSSFLFRHPRVEYCLNICDTAFAVWSCVSFVWQSYLSGSAVLAAKNSALIARIEIVDLLAALFFAATFAKDLVLAHSKRDFFMTMSTWVDIVTTFPSIIAFGLTIVDLESTSADAAANLTFLRFFRILKVIRLSRVTRGAPSSKPAGMIQAQINELLLTMIATLFIFSGAFQMVEQLFVPAAEDAARRQGSLDFINSVFFTVSTVATVGFGDVVPLSIPGKGLVVVLLCFIITVVSQKISAITTLMSKQSKYERMGYSFSAPHVIICGGIDTQHLETFLRDLFHKDHNKPGEKPIRAVIVAQRDPDYEMISIVTDPSFSDRAMYVNGNLLEEDDLRRVSAHKAKAMFIFCSQSSMTNQQRNDSEVLLQSMALLSFVQKQQSAMPRIIAMVHFGLTLRRFKAIMAKSEVNHQVVCLEELKPALMVQGCINPGFSGLAYSMIRSFTLSDILQHTQLELMPPWQKEFIDGMDYELYSTTLSANFSGMSFAAAAAVLYEHLQIFLVALEIDGATHLAPLAYTFPNSATVAHVLAGSAKHAVKVSAFVPPADAARVKQRSMLQRMQSAAHKVATQGAVASALKRRASASADKKAELDQAESKSRTVVSLKDMSLHWKKLRSAVKIGALFASKSSQSLSKDSYEFLLQSDKNPRFARLEAKKSFLILDEDVPFEKARVSQYEGFDHIVFCCRSDRVPGALAGSLKRFIAPLRSKSCVFVSTPIVVMACSITAKDFEAIAMYPGVFVVIGNPLLQQDLRRAGVASAKYGVVCSRFLPNDVVHASEKDDCTAADTAAMFAGNLMKKLNSGICVVVELQYSRSVKFIGVSPKENHEIGVATASGRYFSVQYFHVLMCRCFYAPFCLSLLQEFLRPHPSFITDTDRNFTYSSSIMTTVPVPGNFVGCSFASVYKVCAAVGIPIAIYRAVTVSNCAHERFLVCCPSSSMRLNPADHLILLSPLPPSTVQACLGSVDDFESGMDQHLGNPADKWQAVYDGVDSQTNKAALQSLSSESLLVQLVDETAKKVREIRYQLDNPDQHAFADARSPGLRSSASLKRQSTRRTGAILSSMQQFSPQ